MRFIKGDLTFNARRLVNPKVGIVFALHGIMSGQSETDYDLGMAVNLDSTRALLEAIRHQGSPNTKVVFTSTTAVYGGDFPVPADEQFMLKPQSSYGCAKACVELLVNDYTRRGWLDGRVFRIPTVSIRPGKPSSAASSYVSGIIREPLQGIEHVCPVDRQQPSWICPPRTILQNLIFGATIDGKEFGAHSRTVNLPGMKITVDEQLKALEKVAPEALQYIRFEPDQAVRNIVDTWIPELDVARAYSLGFEKAASFETAIEDFQRTLLKGSNVNQALPENPKVHRSLDLINQDLVKDHPSPDVEDIDRQEAVLRFDSITHEDCLQIGLALLDAVKRLDPADFKPVIIDIELNDKCVFHYAMPGTSHDNQWWIERKRKTVKHFGKSSYRVGRAMAKEGKSWSEKYAGLEEGDYAAHGGCWPIQLCSGVLIGTITMSGLAQVLDHVMIARILASHLMKA